MNAANISRLFTAFFCIAAILSCSSSESSSSQLKDQAIPGVSGCSASQAQKVNQAVQDTLAALDRESCAEVLDQSWKTEMRARLTATGTIACADDLPGSGEVAAWIDGRIFLRAAFFASSRESAAETIFHETAHAIGVAVGVDHNDQGHPVPSSGDLRDVFYFTDPVYFCSTYCNATDPRAAVGQFLWGLVATTTEEAQVVVRLRHDLATFDLVNHAKALCRRQQTASYFAL